MYTFYSMYNKISRENKYRFFCIFAQNFFAFEYFRLNENCWPIFAKIFVEETTKLREYRGIPHIRLVEKAISV